MIKQNNLFLYATLVLVATLSLCYSNPATSASAKISLTSYSNQMSSFMNKSVDPCTDFYEYACGNWKNAKAKRWTLERRNNFNEISYKLDDIVERILTTPATKNGAPEYAAEFELANNFYSNCLKAKFYPMQESSEYIAFLKTIGGFPAVDESWNSRSFDWLNMSAHLSNYGINTFVSEGILEEYPFTPYFKIPDFGFDIALQSDTINNSSSIAYKANEKRMRDILNNYRVKDDQIKDIITETFNFLKQIFKVRQKFADDYEHCIKYSRLIKNSKIAKQWRVYNDIAWMGKKFESITKDCCTPCLFLHKEFNRICKNNKRAAANYLSLKFLFAIDVRPKDSSFQKDFCISHIRSSMEYLFDYLYMKTNFANETRQEITYITKEIRESVRTVIKEASWMDETSRNAALLQESKIVEHIGRYENMSYTELLVREIKNLQFESGNYAKNNMNLRKFKQHMARFNGLNFEQLGLTTKPPYFSLGMQAKAFYQNFHNSIYVMAGILNEPVYHKDWPNSLKFGTLGFIIGHELIYGFDILRAVYDDKSEINNLYADESGIAFEERAFGYVNNNQSYIFPEINLKIEGIRIVDDGNGAGLREALMAYRRYTKQSTKDVYKEEQMPNIDLSPEQLFFLAFAQMWCVSDAEDDYWQSLKSSYVIDKYRVLGTLSNNADFATVYKCSLGS